MRLKVKEAIGIQEAMDNLTAISEIDLASPPPIGIVKGRRLVTDEEEFPKGSVQWLAEEGSDRILRILDATYRTVRLYLQSLLKSPETKWEDEKVKRGLAATMALVGESAPLMDRYLAFRFDREEVSSKISDREEFQKLQRFYVERIIKKFEGGVEGDEAWKEQWAENGSALEFDIEKSGLGDFETIRRDQAYELFYLRNEEGQPYFSLDLLRNLKLTADFETDGKSFEEDPLLKIRAMQDRDLQCSSRQMLGECHAPMAAFFKISRKFPDNDLVQCLNKALFALFLASNPRYLIQNTMGKSCLHYFEDFHSFLRQAFATTEYQKWIAYPPEEGEKVAHALLSMTHVLCRSLFFRVGGVKQETIGLIRRSMRRGEEMKKRGSSKEFWSLFQLEDENLRALMERFPNGPLFKILDLVREEEVVPFDPIFQGNLPSRLYEVDLDGKRMDLLRMPAPTRQTFLHKAELIEEFRGLVRALAAEDPPKTHLFINLQDRSSSREAARSRVIEGLQKSAEFSKQVYVFTLPKDNDFYHQNGEYISLNDAKEFLRAFKEQLLSSEDRGFSLPRNWKEKDFERFINASFSSIHEQLFASESRLVRRAREDFIELFYHLLILKIVEQLAPDSLSFTCKDALDTGAAFGASFYAFCKILTGGFSEKEDGDFLRWLFYAPALFCRERAIDYERVGRALSFLERFDALPPKKREAFFKLFSIKSLNIKHL